MIASREIMALFRNRFCRRKQDTRSNWLVNALLKKSNVYVIITNDGYAIDIF